MVFSEFYKSHRSPLSKLRHQQPQPIRQCDDWDPELLSKDKDKQKAAVKRYLREKVCDDWDFPWPPQQPHASHGALGVESKAQAAAEIEVSVKVAFEDSGVKDTQLEEAALKEHNSAAPLLVTAQLQAADNPTLDTAANDTPEPAPQDAWIAIDSPAAELEEEPSRDPGYDADSGSESDYSVVSEDVVNFHSRTEWDSGEETEDDELSYASSPIRNRPAFPFRFEDPDTVAYEIQTQLMEKKAQRRRAHRREMKWNDGLACFEARRDAWTGAKTVRLKPAPLPVSPTQEKALSPLSPRRFFARDRGAPMSPVGTHGMAPLALHGSRSSGDSGDGEGVFSVRETTSKDTNTSSNSDDCDAGADDLKKAKFKLYPVVTLLPNPPPLLPPENPMRASITPATYNSIFEKIVLQGMMPSCPVNLSDMVRACVAGWKRRNEWPPRLTAPEPMFSRRRGRDQPSPLYAIHMATPRPPRQPPGPVVPQLQSPVGRFQGSPAVQPPSTTPPIMPASPPAPSPPPKSETRRKSFSFLTRERSKGEKDKEKDGDSKGEEGHGKAFRRSIQKVLGWHPHHARGGSHDGLPNPASTGNSKVSGEGSRSEGQRSAGGKSDPAPAVVSPQLARGRSSVEAGINTFTGESKVEDSLKK